MAEADFDTLTGVLADEIRMYAQAHGTWLPIDLARNLTKQLRVAGWTVTPPVSSDANYTACAFALGRGEYCKGDARFPATHSTRCPFYAQGATDA